MDVASERTEVERAGTRSPRVPSFGENGVTMASERRLTVETALAVVVPHLLAVNVNLWLARRVPALALDETETVYVPSFSSLRMTPVGAALTSPGLWVYLRLVWLCFGGWVYLRRDSLRAWGRELLADSNPER